MKIKTLFIAFLLMGFLVVEGGGAAQAATLSCYVWNNNRHQPKGQVDGIDPSIVAPSSYGGICDYHIHTCNGECSGALQ